MEPEETQEKARVEESAVRRRTIVKGAAWSVPVIMGAGIAVPNASASPAGFDQYPVGPPVSNVPVVGPGNNPIADWVIRTVGPGSAPGTQVVVRIPSVYNDPGRTLTEAAANPWPLSASYQDAGYDVYVFDSPIAPTPPGDQTFRFSYWVSQSRPVPGSYTVDMRLVAQPGDQNPVDWHDWLSTSTIVTG